MCKYCDENMSHGNKAIVKDANCEAYIVEHELCILIESNNVSTRVKLEYCPMCGRNFNFK